MIYDTSTWEFMIDYELEYNGERVGHSICVPEGESVKIKIMQYHSDYAQKNNYTLVDKDIEFEVTVWNPNEKGEYMWYDENGNEVYGNEKPEIKK